MLADIMLLAGKMLTCKFVVRCMYSMHYQEFRKFKIVIYNIIHSCINFMLSCMWLINFVVNEQYNYNNDNYYRVVKLRAVLAFFSGGEEIPPMGFLYKPQLYFNPENMYPTASTCVVQLTLPTQYKEYKQFRSACTTAFVPWGIWSGIYRTLTLLLHPNKRDIIYYHLFSSIT